MIDVLCIGELNVDLVLSELPELPDFGTETIAKKMILALGSSTAICAAGLAELSLNTSLFSLIGDDDYGNYCLKKLKEYNVKSLVIKDKTQKTGITVSMNTVKNKDRALLTYLGTIDKFDASQLDYALLDTVRHIHVGSFFLQTALRKNLLNIFKTAQEKGVTTSLDAGFDETNTWNLGLFDLLKYTTIFLPNEIEAFNITGEIEPLKAAEKLACYSQIAVVKCGSNGSVCFTNNESYSSPAIPANVIDTTGAGDSFNAGFISAYLNKKAIGECLLQGNKQGSIAVSRYGGFSK